MTSTSSMPSSSASSSFLLTDAALSLATFGIVTAIVTTLERQKQQKRKGSTTTSTPIPHYPHHPPERIVKYLQTNAGKKWTTDYSISAEVFVRDCPKVELHVHLDGALDPDFLWHCLQAYEERGGGKSWIACLPVSTTLPWDAQRPLPVRHLVQKCQTVNDFHDLCTCRRGQRSLQHMLTCFEIFLPLVRGAPPALFLLEELAHDFCRRQWEQNVVYTEVRYCPHLLMNETSKTISGSYDMGSSTQDNTNSNTQDQKEEQERHRMQSAREVMQAVTRGLRRGCADFEIVVNQIICAINWRPDWAWDVLALAEEFQEEQPCGVVGIDIAAGEEHYDADNYPELYRAHFDMMQQAQEKNIPVAIHAGETPNGIQHVRHALATNKDATNPGYGARRIGHGYRMVDSVELMQQVANSKVHVEICPTSSVETGGWIFEDNSDITKPTTKRKPWADHPGLKMMKHGIPISLNSDDPAVFHTSLTWQYRIALAKMGMTQQQIVQTNLDAIDASFGCPHDKQRICKELQAYMQRLSSQECVDNTATATTSKRFTDRVRDPWE